MDPLPQDALRLLVPVLLAGLIAVLARTPQQARSNRWLAVFLGLVSLGFLFEYVGILLQERAPNAAAWGLELARAAGKADPVVLLAYALSVRPLLGPLGRFGWVAVAGIAAVDFATRSVWLDLAYVNGTYLAAFGLILVQRQRESSPVVRRELSFVTVGVGFAALSRSAAVFEHLPPPYWIQLGPGLAAAGFGVALILLGVVAVASRFAVRSGAAPVGRLLVTTVGLLAGFHAVWGLIAAVEAGSTATSPVATAWWGYRWIPVAAIVGYGILRFQIFDLHLQARRALVALTVVPVAFVGVVAVAAATGRGGLDPVAAQLVGLLFGVGFALAVYPFARWATRGVVPNSLSWGFATRRLEIYEATLRQGLAAKAWRPEARRLVEALQMALEISPEEHARIAERLRPQAGRP